MDFFLGGNKRRKGKLSNKKHNKRNLSQDTDKHFFLGGGGVDLSNTQWDLLLVEPKRAVCSFFVSCWIKQRIVSPQIQRETIKFFESIFIRPLICLFKDMKNIIIHIFSPTSP